MSPVRKLKIVFNFSKIIYQNGKRFQSANAEFNFLTG